MHVDADECCMLPLSQVSRCKGWSQLQRDFQDHIRMSPLVPNMACVLSGHFQTRQIWRFEALAPELPSLPK